MAYPAATHFHTWMIRLFVIIIMAIAIINPSPADMVLLDEYWTQEIVNNGVEVTEIDTLETGDPTQAKSGECSALLGNEWGWPGVRFRGAARVVLSEIPPGDSEARVWYRTNGWDGKWRLEIWTYHRTVPPVGLTAYEPKEE